MSNNIQFYVADKTKKPFRTKQALNEEAITELSNEGFPFKNLTHSEPTSEDFANFIDSPLRNRDVILKEKWDIETIQGKIIGFNQTEVFVDCLMNIERNEFQTRSFPLFLFERLDSISEGQYVAIKSKRMPGSYRMDIYNGKGIVNVENFQIKVDWESLQDEGLDKKITEW